MVFTHVARPTRKFVINTQILGARQTNSALTRTIAVAIPLLLIAPAIWNGYPLLQFDTGGYLARWYEGYLVPSRSTVFGLYLHFGQGSYFWINLGIQALATLWILQLTLKVFGLRTPFRVAVARLLDRVGDRDSGNGSARDRGGVDRARNQPGRNERTCGVVNEHDVGLRCDKGFESGILLGIDAGLAVRAADRPQDIAAWRPTLGQTGPLDALATVLVRDKDVAAPPARRRTGLWTAAAVAVVLRYLGERIDARGTPPDDLTDPVADPLAGADTTESPA